MFPPISAQVLAICGKDIDLSLVSNFAWKILTLNQPLSSMGTGMTRKRPHCANTYTHTHTRFRDRRASLLGTTLRKPRQRSAKIMAVLRQVPVVSPDWLTSRKHCTTGSSPNGNYKPRIPPTALPPSSATAKGNGSSFALPPRQIYNTIISDRVKT